MITDKGFERPIFADLLSGQLSRAKALFGEDTDLSEMTALGKFLRIAVYDLAVAYEQLEQAYFARFPNTASGISLDRLCPFAGILRNPPTAALHSVRFTGTPGFTVPLEFLVSTEKNILFYVLEEVTLDADGSGETTVACTEFGEAGNVAAESIQHIVNPTSNLSGVEHLAVLSLGTETENDYSLRRRWKQAIAGAGSANAAAIQAEILRVPNIESVTVMENDQDYPDDMGRPPHTFEAYVLGDATKDEEIARAIFRKKPIGIKAHGQIAVPVPDEGGFLHTIRFTRTEEIWLKMKITIRTGNTFEGESGKWKIAETLTEYVMSLGNGDSVIHSSLYGYIHSVAGVVETTNIQISTDNGASYFSGNVRCEPWQVVRMLEGGVEVITVE